MKSWIKTIRQSPEKLAALLVDRLHMDRMEGSNRKLNEAVQALAGGKKEAVREYHIKKMTEILCVALIAMILIIVCLVWFFSKENEIENAVLERPGYGAVSREEDLLVNVNGLENEMTYEISGRKYSAAEANQLLKKAQDDIEANFLQDNASAQMVRSGLYFPRQLYDGAVSVEWSSRPYGVIADDGQLEGQASEKVDENGTLVNIEAVLTCQGQNAYFETAVKVYPKELTEEESLWQSVHRALERADKLSREKAYLPLPAEVNGIKLYWTYQRGKEGILIIFLLIMLPAFLWTRSDTKIKEKAQQRRSELLIDYPELMWKMTMLLGAGLTIGGAFRRIAEDYRKEKEEKGGKYSRYLYEEMLYTCREIRNGMAEAKAYENFGRRCELPRYIKFGTMLSQNLKKGSRGLAGMLEQEAMATSQERRNEARKQGEKAGTKLLMPMMLMLVVVLVILVVPAFLNM